MTKNKSKEALFWVITIAFPFMILALIEIGLRIGGYNEEAQDLFIEAPNNDQFLIANPEYVGRYFPSFVPQIAPNPFRKEKRSNTFRVFVFGGSSTQGFPYNFYSGFPEQLEQILLLNTERVNVEVINLGMTAVNSYVIHDLAKRVLPYEPDVVLIYAGHNEFYGSFGAATTQFGLVNSVGLKRLIIWLKNLRLYQLLESIMSSDDTDSSERRTMMAKVVRESDIELNSELFEQGIEQFEKNIGDVLESFKKEGIPIYIGTVASNLKDQPPLGDSELAIEKYANALNLFEEGELDSALNDFIEAKELDGIRFRAPGRINELIKDLAIEHDANVVDVEGFLRTRSESGIEDNSLFIDHLHPNAAGYKSIAGLFFEHLLEIDEIKRNYKPNRFTIPERVSSFEDTYSNTSVSRLLVGYPFKKGLSEEEELALFQKIYEEYLSSNYIDSVAAFTARTNQEVPRVLTDIVNDSKQKNDSLAVISHYYELLRWQLNSVDLIEKGIEYSVNHRPSDVYLVSMILQVLNDGLYDPRYMNVLSAIYIINGDLDKAQFWLEESERLGSNEPMLFYNFTRYYLLRGENELANGYYNRYLQATQTN